MATFWRHQPHPTKPETSRINLSADSNQHRLNWKVDWKFAAMPMDQMEYSYLMSWRHNFYIHCYWRIFDSMTAVSGTTQLLLLPPCNYSLSHWIIHDGIRLDFCGEPPYISERMDIRSRRNVRKISRPLTLNFSGRTFNFRPEIFLNWKVTKFRLPNLQL